MINYFTLYQGRPYLSEQYLYQRGISQDMLSKFCKKFRDGTSSLCAYYQEGKFKWFLYNLLPTKWITKYSLPKTTDDMHALVQMQTEDQKTLAEGHIHFVLNNAWNDPIRWKPFIDNYRSYFLDRDLLIKFAKTHALFFEILRLNENFSIEVIHSIYSRFEDAIYKTSNSNSFGNKIRLTKNDSIENTIMHDFTTNSRTPYKVDGVLLSRIKYYYCNPKRYTYPQILKFVNNERFDRGLTSISLSTLKRVLLDRELRNICDPIRLGKKFGEAQIYPYLNRKDPAYGDLLEIDSTRINIPYKDDSDEINFLHLCVVMEVSTRKIIGSCLSYSEDPTMILTCLKDGLNNLGYIPRQILHDNHKSYYSSQFKKFSNAAFELGIDFRAAKVGNARDKAHVERWFGTFQSEFTNSVFGSLGEGVKTSRVGGRASKELEKIYRKKKYLRTEDELRKLISVLIAKYNAKPRIKGSSPNELMDKASKNELKVLNKPDLVRMFFRNKIKRIKNDQVVITIGSKPYYYKLQNNALCKKFNGKEVIVMYDENDLSFVSAFDKNNKKYLCDINLDEEINAIPTKKDWSVISKHHWTLKKRIEANLNELNGEIEEGREQLEAIPIVALNPKAQLDEVLNRADNDWLADKMTESKPNKKSKGKTPDRTPVTKKFNVKGSLKKVRK